MPTRPANPSLRRSALVRRREEDGDDEPGSLTPNKRAKVSFATDTPIKTLRDCEKSADLIREEVHRAFERHALGDDTGYVCIKELYTREVTSEDAPTQTIMRRYTSALTSQVSMLNKRSSDLIHAVLNSQWLGRDENYVTIYTNLLGNLVSAQTPFLADVLRMLVANLTSSPPSGGNLPNHELVQRTQIYSRAHSALAYILRLIPSASRMLAPIASASFPHSSDSRKAHTIYIQNLIEMIGYVPELRSELLTLITERLVKIDVQVQVDIEDLADEVGDGLMQGLPRLQTVDEDESDNDDNDSISDEDITDPETQKTKDILRNVETMDTILDILFAYYSPLFSSTPTIDRARTFEILLFQFTSIIVPTYGSRHTQFLLFHFAQTSPLLVEKFLSSCISVAFDKSRARPIRHAAICYLASFVARGLYVPSPVVREIFDYIADRLGSMRANLERDCRSPNLQRFPMYYSLVQALLYIFCFRWHDLEARSSEDADEENSLPDVDGEKQERIWLPGVRDALAQNVFSKLNPLKICSPIIVTEFARISNHLGLVYVFHLLETNKRLRLSNRHYADHVVLDAFGQPERETALSQTGDEQGQQLDGYFPFDPYHLPKSGHWITGGYREWKGIPGLDNEKGLDIRENSVSEAEEQVDVETDISSDDS